MSIRSADSLPAGDRLRDRSACRAGTARWVGSSVRSCLPKLRWPVCRAASWMIRSDLRRIVGHVEQLQVGRRRSSPRAAIGVAQPVHQPSQYVPPEQHHRETASPCRSGSGSAPRTARPGCRSRRETPRRPSSTSRTSSCGRRRTGSTCSADVRIGPLLVRQLDVAADREPVPFHRAPVGRLHDPRAAAGDDREAGLGEQPGGLDRQPGSAGRRRGCGPSRRWPRRPGRRPASRSPRRTRP